MTREEKINLLLDFINEDEMIREYTLKYHDMTLNSHQQEGLLKTAMEAFESFEEAFERLLNNDDFKMIVHDVVELRDELLSIIDEHFDNAEERAVKEEIAMDPSLFSALDDYKKDIIQDLMHRRPKDLFELGETYIQQEHFDLPLSEDDLMSLFYEELDQKYIMKELAEKFAHIIDNHTKYVLEIDEEDEVLEGVQEVNQGDYLLTAVGNYNIDDYFDVYPFLFEYTGERISYVGADDEEISYWDTYESYFQEKLRGMLIGSFKKVIDDLNQNRHSDYTALMDVMKLSPKEYGDTAKVLNQSAFIYEKFADLEENIFSKFVSAEANEMYKLGKKGSQQ